MTPMRRVARWFARACLLVGLAVGTAASPALAGWETVKEFYGQATITIVIDYESSLEGQRHILRKNASATVNVVGHTFDGAYSWPIGNISGRMSSENTMINLDDGSSVKGTFSGTISKRFDGETHGGPGLRVNKEEGLYRISLPHLYATGTATVTVPVLGTRTDPNAEDEAKPFMPARYREPVEYDPEAGYVAGGFTHAEELPYYPKPIVVTVTANWHFDFELPPLQAEAGDMQWVERGEVATLDGSGSTGRIEQYRWQFKPADDCPDETYLEGAEKQGRTVEVQVLCPIEVKLTVSDGIDTDEDDTAIVVEPRDWKTDFSESSKELKLGDAEKPWVLDSGERTDLVGGENVCVHEGSPQEYHNFHPMRQEDSWEGGGYTLELIQDTGGPFDGYWYLSEYKLEIRRAIAVNPYLQEGGTPLITGNDNLYSENVAAGTDFAAYLAAIRAHEHDHTTLKEEALEDNDPAKDIEDEFSRDRDELKEKVDWKIRTAERRICEHSSDPMPGKSQQQFNVQLRTSPNYQTVVLPVCVGGTCERNFPCP